MGPWLLFWHPLGRLVEPFWLAFSAFERLEPQREPFQLQFWFFWEFREAFWYLWGGGGGGPGGKGGGVGGGGGGGEWGGGPGGGGGWGPGRGPYRNFCEKLVFATPLTPNACSLNKTSRFRPQLCFPFFVCSGFYRFWVDFGTPFL